MRYLIWWVLPVCNCHSTRAAAPSPSALTTLNPLTALRPLHAPQPCSLCMLPVLDCYVMSHSSMASGTRPGQGACPRAELTIGVRPHSKQPRQFLGLVADCAASCHPCLDNCQKFHFGANGPQPMLETLGIALVAE